MGFLNPSPDDEAHIQAMADGGTTELPGASGLDGLLSAIPKGAAAGLVKVGQLGNDIAGTDAGYSFFESPSPNQLLQHMQQPQQDSDAYKTAAAATQVVQQWAATGQDPRVTGGLGRIAASTAEGMTIFTAGAPAGPWGAASLLGSSEGYGDYLQNRAEGLDENTALEKAGLTGVTAAASAFLPMKFGKTALQSVLGGAASNVAVGLADRAATNVVLRANGYNQMADQAKVFDSQAMLADTIMGAAFGAFGHYTHGGEPATAERVNPADVDAAAATLVEDHLNRSAPGIPTDPEVANLHIDTMQHAIDALTNGREVETPSETDARTLLQDSLPDPAHDTGPAILEAAHEELPGFTDAVEPIKEVAPQPPAEGPALGLHVAADGTPSPTQFDSATQFQLDRLVSRYPDLQITREDGSTATVREIAQEMQQEIADAQKYADAHEVAAACFIATGEAG